jgi:hypothetical protein
VAALLVSDPDLALTAQFWWHSPRLAGGRRGPLRPVDLPEYPWMIGAELSVADLEST